MTEAATTASAVTAEDGANRARRRAAERDLLRDIAVGGLAGLLAGTVIGGVGGRVVMRLAALLAPDAVGQFTENGFRIGTITLQGSLGLVLFGGIVVGVFAAAVWVVARPWLPRALGLRAIISAPLALAMTGFGLISAGNADFRILGFDPAIVAVLVVLVALGGPFLAIADAALDRWLPRPGPGRRVSTLVYGVILFFGVALTAFVVAPTYLGSEIALAGAAIIVTGVATLVASSERLQAGLDRRVVAAAPWLGRGGLVVATLIGLAYLGGQVGAILARA